MAAKTLKELRASAKARGIKGYSKLSRAALEHVLANTGSQKTAPAKTKIKPAVKKKSARTKNPSIQPMAKSTPAAGSMPPAAQRVAVPAKPLATNHLSNEEERVENAKYATVLPGSTAPSNTSLDLGEDIDNLPPITEPMLCLLPQKPGVLHGYWVTPPNSPLSHALKLRLGCITGDTFEIIDEIALPQQRGRWYFHVDESANLEVVYLLLGYYEPDGRFVTASRRGIARIPSLYASERTDRLWWVSEEQFRSMYRRAGGYARGRRLGWSASISSPDNAPSSDRLAWRGNVSSR